MKRGKRVNVITKRKGKKMKKLTIEEKAKRYEYLENTFLELLDRTIDDTRDDEGDILEPTPVGDIVENVMNDVDNALSRDLYMLFDKICSENFRTYLSIKKSPDEAIRKRYENFERLIGEKQ